jgi:hypothetical protein
MAHDTYYWCGISGWGLAGLFAVLLGMLGISAKLQAYRQLIPRRIAERPAPRSDRAPRSLPSPLFH